jgi:hypothetical protein
MPAQRRNPRPASRKGPVAGRTDGARGSGRATPAPSRPTGSAATRHRPTVRAGVEPWWRRHLGWLVTAAVVLLAAAGTEAVLAARGSAQPVTAPAAPLLASTDAEPSGATVDGIQAQSSEQALFHIHAHLAVYVNGTARTIPEGIGIVAPRQEEQSDSGPFVVAGAAFYWLHTHTPDGVIHIESPVQRTYTLGDFFDVWGQPLSSTQVGPAHGTVIAYLNGQRYAGDPRSLPLTAHAVVQLDVGGDVAPQPYTFAAGL